MLKKKNAKIIAIVLLLLLSFGVVFQSWDNSNKTEDGKGQVYSIYELGSINSETGRNMSTKKAIRTKEMISFEGLETKWSYSDNLLYYLYFYDENGKYLGCDYYQIDIDVNSLRYLAYFNDIYSVRIVLPAKADVTELKLLDYWSYIKNLKVYNERY